MLPKKVLVCLEVSHGRLPNTLGHFSAFFFNSYEKYIFDYLQIFFAKKLLILSKYVVFLFYMKYNLKTFSWYKSKN